MERGTALRFEGVSFAYGRSRGQSRTLRLAEIGFSLRFGECAVIAGTNGSGKTTLLSLAAGIFKPTAGRVECAGRAGYVPQGSALLEDATVGENLRFFADLAGAGIPDPLPFAVGGWMERRVSRLSGGMKKQVSIACAMAGDPDVMILDEPCAALDIRFRESLCSLILDWKAAGKAILYVGHDPAEFFPFCDRLLFLSPRGLTEPSAPLPRNESDFRDLYAVMMKQTEVTE